MTKEYKGLGGSTAIIEGNTIKIKQLFLKTEFPLTEVIYSSINSPKNLGERGILVIRTQKAKYTFVFKKKDLETFQELYDIICNNAADSFQNYIHENNSFTITKEIENLVAFDQNSKRIRIPVTIKGEKKYKFYNFEDIVSFDLLEGGKTITESGLGTAFAGGILFGGTGAVVGSVVGKKNKNICSSLSIKITMNDIVNPVVNIEFIKYPSERGGLYFNQRYALAQECLSVLQIICRK